MFHLKLFQIIDERIHTRHRHRIVERGAHAAGNAVPLEVEQAALLCLDDPGLVIAVGVEDDALVRRDLALDEPGCAQA